MCVTVARSDGAATDFRLLGPVEVVRGGRPVGVGRRQQRALLALLLLEAGRPVSVDRLTHELWRGDPPAGADGTLRVYVSRLRSSLGGGPLVAHPARSLVDV
jgi:DNA-binding SARP family transcriptional activator